MKEENIQQLIERIENSAFNKNDSTVLKMIPQFNFGVDLTKVPVVFSSEGR